MARQFRIQSLDIYSKLGMRASSTSKEVKDSKDSNEPRDIRTSSTQRSPKRPASTMAGRQCGLSGTLNPQRVRSPVNYAKQLPRSELCQNLQDVNANRFVSFNHSPLALTNVKRVSSPNFSLCTGRKKSLILVNGRPATIRPKLLKCMEKYRPRTSGLQ